MADITGSITKIRTSDNNEHYINAKYWDGHEWGELASALKYCGITTTKLTDGATTNPVSIGGTNHTATAGCVVFYEDTEGGKPTTKEFVFNGSKWELLGGDSTYKVVQNPVSSPNADGSAMAFIDTISQDANGVITVTKKYCKKQYRLEYTATESLGNLTPCNINSVLHEYDSSTGKGAFVYDEAPTSIRSTAFGNSTKLTSITIPDSITSIGEGAFINTSLKSVTIGNGVTSIGNYAFSGCDLLASVIIGNGVTSIGEMAFDRCRISSITIPNSVTNIKRGAFYNCTLLKSVTIPDSVTSIGYEAFYGCSSLKSITIPSSVTSIGGGAFYNCTGELIINSKIVRRHYLVDNYPAMGDAGWLRGSKFTKLTIGDVTSIGDSVFRDCTSLTSIIIPDSVNEIGNRAFYGCTSLTSVTIPDSVTSIGDYAFNGCESLTSVTIGNGVTSIGGSAFAGCYSLTSATIGNSVTSIWNYAFAYCTSLKSVTIPDSVTSIGEFAFDHCFSLTSVTIPDGVTSIGYSTFQSCTSLTSVTIGNGVTSIGDGAFFDCTSLISLYCKPTVPPTLGNENGLTDKKIYVPMESVYAYNNRLDWSEGADLIVGCVFEDEALVSGENIKTINGESIIGKGDIKSATMVEITWGELKRLRDNSQLISGLQYRIIDYITTTTQANTKSARHQFDIIVTADDKSTLNEIARACLHEGDTYFSENVAKLEAWQIWYCLDNDINRFTWADEENGKGVIYYMKDEFGNECPYDFKSIQFKRYKITSFANPDIVNSDTMLLLYAQQSSLGYGYEVDVNDFIYCYTFASNQTDDNEDLSVTQECECKLNIIKAHVFDNSNKINLNNNVFFYDAEFAGNGIKHNYFAEGSHDNTFCSFFANNTMSNYFRYNIIGAGISNKFGSYYEYNIMCNESLYNTFDDICDHNIIGYQCAGNIFGDATKSNIIGAGCQTNDFGMTFQNNVVSTNFYRNKFNNNTSQNNFGTNFKFNNCAAYFMNNTFVDNTMNNTFGCSFRTNKFGSKVGINTFGEQCINNTFGSNIVGNTCHSNTRNNIVGANFTHNIGKFAYSTFGNNVHTDVENGAFITACDFGNSSYFNLQVPSSASIENYVKNLKFCNINGTASAYVNITVPTTNQDYELKVAKNSNGELKIYCEADLID